MLSLSFLLITLLLFSLGTVVGSFINVIMYRTFADEQWVKGRSRCDICKKPLKWYELIPLISYFLQGGTTNCCKKPLSISHPVVEFLTGVLFVWWYWGGALFFELTKAPFQVIQPLFWLFVGVLLLIIFFTDLWYMLIPDFAVGALFLLASVYRIALTITGIMRLTDLGLTAVTASLAALFFWSLWYFTKGKGMGFGDVKLVIPLVLLMGWSKSLVGLILSFVIGAIFGVFLIVYKKKTVKYKVPFGPFLIVGTVIALVWGEIIWQWYVGLL